VVFSTNAMNSEFKDIAPYNEEEAQAALQRVAEHPTIRTLSKYLFPDAPSDALKTKLKEISTVQEFQEKIMVMVVEAILQQTSCGFSFDGEENIKDCDKKFLFVSDHRDITLDPALVQYLLNKCNLPMTEICVGNNLLSSQLVEDLMRLNRMIKVIRGIPPREMYFSSQLLSSYIRQSISSNSHSIWIAQREGRSKNGLDITEQGLLKMFDMSGSGEFVDNFTELNIVPLSISYEIEPCDARKAREIYISRRQKYVKRQNEDLHSILTGISQRKGHIHITIGKPLTRTEIEDAAERRGNDRYHALMSILDNRIIGGYKLWKNNFIAYDLMTGSDRYADRYAPEDRKEFIDYMNHKLSRIESNIDRTELSHIFYEIYGNPILNKKNHGFSI